MNMGALDQLGMNGVLRSPNALGLGRQTVRHLCQAVIEIPMGALVQLALNGASHSTNAFSPLKLTVQVEAAPRMWLMPVLLPTTKLLECQEVIGMNMDALALLALNGVLH